MENMDSPPGGNYNSSEEEGLEEYRPTDVYVHPVIRKMFNFELDEAISVRELEQINDYLEVYAQMDEEEEKMQGNDCKDTFSSDEEDEDKSEDSDVEERDVSDIDNFSNDQFNLKFSNDEDDDEDEDDEELLEDEAVMNSFSSSEEDDNVEEESQRREDGMDVCSVNSYTWQREDEDEDKEESQQTQDDMDVSSSEKAEVEFSKEIRKTQESIDAQFTHEFGCCSSVEECKDSQDFEDSQDSEDSKDLEYGGGEEIKIEKKNIEIDSSTDEDNYYAEMGQQRNIQKKIKEEEEKGKGEREREGEGNGEEEQNKNKGGGSKTRKILNETAFRNYVVEEYPGSDINASAMRYFQKIAGKVVSNLCECAYDIAIARDGDHVKGCDIKTYATAKWDIDLSDECSFSDDENNKDDE